jgi:hypothetical protein
MNEISSELDQLVLNDLLRAAENLFVEDVLLGQEDSRLEDSLTCPFDKVREAAKTRHEQIKEKETRIRQF